MVNRHTLNNILMESPVNKRVGIVMLLVECPEALQLAKSIDTDDLFGDDAIEHFHHITIRYDVNEYDPMKMQEIMGDQPFIHSGKPAVKGIGYFENVQDGACDCVFLEISDADTKRLNKIKKLIEANFDCGESRFKDFKAHITIAYVKKGKGKTIAEQLWKKFKQLGLDDFALNGTSLFYSDGKDREATIYLNQK